MDKDKKITFDADSVAFPEVHVGSRKQQEFDEENEEFEDEGIDFENKAIPEIRIHK